MTVRLLIRCSGPDHYAPQTFICAASEFGHTCGDVLQSNQLYTNQPLGVVARVLGDEVIVRLKTGGPERCVVQPVEHHAKGRIQYLSRDAIGILLFQASRGVPYTGWSGLEAFLIVAGKILRVDASAKSTGDWDRRDILADEELSLLIVQTFDRAWCAIAILLIDPVDPQVRRLAHMRVCRNETKLCHSQTLLLLLFFFQVPQVCDDTSVWPLWARLAHD